MGGGEGGGERKRERGREGVGDRERGKPASKPERQRIEGPG